MSDSLNYRDAGVDIDAGNALVERIKPLAKQTQRPEVLGNLGGFGALFDLPRERYPNPVLVSATDGVGTKLKLAQSAGRYHGLGIDLVAMCVNDLITTGAEPLFFLDYYASGQLDVDTATEVIAGIADGCQQSGAALVGGETAEMPGLYQPPDFDMAGFCVGVVDKTAIIDPSKIASGDALIALASNGPHANGFSLIRKLLDNQDISLDPPLDDAPLGDWLLAPTRIYVKSLLPLCQQGKLKGLAHITGGGILENLPRMLPGALGAQLQPWNWPHGFDWLQAHGNIANQDMLRTFNCGIGMIVCVAASDLDDTLAHLKAAGEQAWHCGEIIATTDESRVTILDR